MAGLLARPFRSEIQYQGQYADFAFDLFTASAPVYRNMLTFLGRYGATLRDLRQDAPTVADANISCTLFDLTTTVRFYLDRLEVTFAKFHEVGGEHATHICLDAWGALQASDSTIRLARHTVVLGFHADLVKGTIEELIGQHVAPSKIFGDKTRSAILYYLRDQGEVGAGSNVYLDRSLLKDGALYVKLTLVLDAAQVPLEKVRDRVNDVLASIAKHMGLEVERTH